MGLKIHKPVKSGDSELWSVDISIDGEYTGYSGLGKTPQEANADAHRKLRPVGKRGQGGSK